MVTITNKHLVKSMEALTRLVSLLDLNAKVKLRLARVYKQAEEAHDAYAAVQKGLLRKHGKPMLTANAFSFEKVTDREAYEKELEEIDEDTVELRFDLFRQEDIEKHVSGLDLVRLEWLYGGLPLEDDPIPEKNTEED